jgi:hypothetical protein
MDGMSGGWHHQPPGNVFDVGITFTDADVDTLTDLMLFEGAHACGASSAPADEHVCSRALRGAQSCWTRISMTRRVSAAALRVVLFSQLAVMHSVFIRCSSGRRLSSRRILLRG